MLSLDYTIRDCTDATFLPVDEIRTDLKNNGVCVVKLYDENDPRVMDYERGMDDLAHMLRDDGGTAHGARGMGGIVKTYGAGCDPTAARVRLDPGPRRVHAAIYGLPEDDVMTGWDAVGILGSDAARTKMPKTRHPDAQRDYMARTGGSLQPHVDVGINTYGSRTQEVMKTLHPEFAACVQSQFVCTSVPRGGATLVVAPGAYYDTPVDPALFDTSKNRDFCVCTPQGYEHFRDAWRAVDGVPRGCLILWISQTPHGNKLANVGVDPKRRVVYISWQARALVPEDDRASLKRKKMDVVFSGGSTDHWSTQVPKVHRGSHYSNGKKITKVVYDKDHPPVYDEELLSMINEAF